MYLIEVSASISESSSVLQDMNVLSTLLNLCPYLDMQAPL